MMTNPVGRITQGQFSYLPDLTDAEISLQIQYGLRVDANRFNAVPTYNADVEQIFD